MAIVTLSTAGKTAVLTAINDLLNAGSGAATIKLYTGTKPAGPNIAVTTQTLLGTLTCSDPAGSIDGSQQLVFGSITQDSSADNNGTATWARLADSNGTAVIDVDVTTTGSGGFLQMNTTNIVAGGPILISSLIITA